MKEEDIKPGLVFWDKNFPNTKFVICMIIDNKVWYDLLNKFMNLPENWRWEVSVLQFLQMEPEYAISI